MINTLPQLSSLQIFIFDKPEGSEISEEQLVDILKDINVRPESFLVESPRVMAQDRSSGMYGREEYPFEISRRSCSGEGHVWNVDYGGLMRISRREQLLNFSSRRPKRLVRRCWKMLEWKGWI